MSAQAPSSSSSGAASKVAVLNSGELFPISQVAGASTIARVIEADAAPSAGADAKGQRRKVATSFERSFAVPEPAPSTSQGTASRPVLKAGKAVSSAPPAAPPRAPTELEKAFASRPVQDQRWLLSFPLAMKQFYFNFAESTNHDQILTGLINRFPELLDSSGASPPALQVAIERGNWTPAMRFVTAIAASPHIKLLRHECGDLRRTYPMLVMEQLGRTSSDSDKDAEREVSMARPVLRAMLNACPDLLTSADASGRNSLHYCSLHCSSNEGILTALLQDLRDLSSDSGSTFSGRLGNALVARDSDGCQPGDLAVSPAAKEAFQRLQADFQSVKDQDQQMVESPVSTIDSLCAALEEGRKSGEFVSRVMNLLAQRNPQLMLLPSVDDPVRTALTWLQRDSKAELKQALTDVGMADLTCLIDCL